uniref:GST C-terminal domain-containing protein n=1 Tax=Chromera velia CCMP2878 TaxID=1169474 RepID=A0A0G4HSA7_9ALVE|eukprot:Cvel_8236.t1-p1 / transcript=Cvel_8236.t1 / gene=Cvel_8236 / organism=Chromera_velia_CCMP2878 / gene_product=hypothetical protein / transcript_product=hypothetical protein / location=Cvel_scaffold450:26941-27318(+) / protein_length=126 / sequence_SO=supercontig / SO=protein_coding / is_pseudo=false
MERLALRILAPCLKALMRQGFRLTDSARNERRLAFIRSLLDETDAALQKSSAYITGPSLSYVDIAFASLMAPLLPGSVAFCKGCKYGRGRFQSFDGAWCSVLEFEAELSRRPCGKHVQRLYKEFRT